MTTIFYTVGSRDVQVPDAFDDAQAENERLRRDTRKAGNELLSRWQAAERNNDSGELGRLRERYRIEQLEAAVNAILTREDHIDRLYLVVSDQTNAEPRHSTDTIAFGRLACAMLKIDTRYKNALKRPPEVIALKRGNAGINPSDYGDCFEMLRRKLPGLRLPRSERVYLCPTSGTPAMTMGLVLSGLLTAETRSTVLYKNPDESEPRLSEFPRRFLRELRRRDLEATLKRRDYAAAGSTLRSVDAPAWLVATVEAATARLNFDFGTGLRRLEAHDHATTPKASVAFAGFRDSLKHLASLSTPVSSQLAELAVQIQILWDSERYLDFTQRVILFLENAAGLIIDRGLGLSEGGKRGEHLAQLFDDGPAQVSELVHFTKGRNIRPPSRVNADTNVSVFLLVSLLDFVTSSENAAIARLTSAETETMLDAIPKLNKLDRLRDRRNRGVHGLGGVGRETIANEYGDSRVDMQENLTEADNLPGTLLTCARSLASIDPHADPAMIDIIVDWPQKLEAAVLTWFDAS